MTDDGSTPVPDVAEASAAFQALGNETRVAIVRALVADSEAGVVPATRSFSELRTAVDADTSAGFAYHLRQLTDRYLRETDEGYTLTYAGLRVARALAAGTYTESVDRDGLAIGDDCPLCGEPGLSARGSDNVLTVGCTDCGRDLLALPLPPGGQHTHDDVIAALDRQHRHRIALMVDGNCPDCAGAVSTAVERHEPETFPGETRARLVCRGCGSRLRLPVALAVVDHPAVVALYHEHGVDIRDRPIWNLGDEWSETLVSEEPLVVRVSTVVGEECLSLFVGGDLTVVHTERNPVGDGETGRDCAAA